MDMRDFIKFMNPIKCAIQHQETVCNSVSFSSLVQGEGGNENFEIEGMDCVFSNFLENWNYV